MLSEGERLVLIIEQNTLYERLTGCRRYAFQAGEVPSRHRCGGLNFDSDYLACCVFQNEIDLDLILIAIMKN